MGGSTCHWPHTSPYHRIHSTKSLCLAFVFFIEYSPLGLGFEYFIYTVLQCDLPLLRPHCGEARQAEIWTWDGWSIKAGTLTTWPPHLLKDHHTTFLDQHTSFLSYFLLFRHFWGYNCTLVDHFKLRESAHKNAGCPSLTNYNQPLLVVEIVFV